MQKKTPNGSDVSAVENFLMENINFFDNSKIMRDIKDNYSYITVMIVKENIFKKLLKRRKYYSAIVVIYKFDSSKKLLDISIDGVYP